MKPDFALSLSFEGITLLQRAADGWLIVGEVPVASETLARDLGALREKASAGDDAPFYCKLVIPNEQIRYMAIATEGLGPARRDAAARRALDGATPYAVTDLIYDTAQEGDTTHVAAVARETLLEAEAFAEEHRFGPVSFVAIPAVDGYPGEPFFGPARAADEVGRIDPDDEPIAVVGFARGRTVKARPPAPPPIPPEPAIREPAPATVAAPRTDSGAKRGAPDQPQSTSPRSTAAQNTGKPAPRKSPASASVDDRPRATPVPAADAAPRPAPATATPVAPPEPEPQPRTARPSGAAPTPPPAPGFTSRRARRAANATGDAASLVAAPSINLGTEKTPGRAEPSAPVSKPVQAPAPPPKPAATSIPVARPIPVPKPAPKPSAAASNDLAARISKRDQAAKTAAAEAEQMAVFGARPSQTGVRGKPRFLGLFLTAALLLLLAGVAAWATGFVEEGIARLFSRSAPTIAAISAPGDDAAAVLPQPDPERPAAAPAPQPVPAAPLREASLPRIEERPAQSTRPAIPLDTYNSAGTEPEARYAVTGIWVRGPRKPTPPAMISIDDIYVASVDPEISGQDAVALPEPNQARRDLTIGAVPSPAAPETVFTRDARGLIVPVPGGALDPGGFTVVLGRPDVVPPPLPERLRSQPETAAQDEVDSARAALAGLRPRLRPANLVEQTERAALGGLTLTELATVRPRPRPARAVTPVIALDQSDGDGSDDAARTGASGALAASLVPNPRPRDFAPKSRTPQADNPPRQVASARATPRTVRPSIPSSASVARQATVKNAINLSRVNLIGVYGKASNRRALIRLPSGRYRKVKVGDRIDGGRISAIGDSELRYQKGGRNLTLTVPSG